VVDIDLPHLKALSLQKHLNAHRLPRLDTLHIIDLDQETANVIDLLHLVKIVGLENGLLQGIDIDQIIALILVEIVAVISVHDLDLNLHLLEKDMAIVLVHLMMTEEEAEIINIQKVAAKADKEKEAVDVKEKVYVE
jgi:hypothetical protein